MRLFISSRQIHGTRTDEIKCALLRASNDQIAILQQTEHIENWKATAERKLRESDFALFVLEASTFDSENVLWEYEKAKELHKRIVGFRSMETPGETIVFCEGFQVFDKAKDCFEYLSGVLRDDRELLIEQYKLMVASTEKVTAQRLSVNNLFFTVTSSVVSLALIAGKALEFSLTGMIGMAVFTGLALLLTYFWSSMVTAYGRLNKGKFKLINEIERKLRTDMFEREWDILTKQLEYKPNTKTENSIVLWYQLFILSGLLAELIYILWLLFSWKKG